MITATCLFIAAALVFGPGVREWLLSLKPAPAPRAKPAKKPSPKKPKRTKDE